MKTLAPELSALMTIFGSAGPVISTRRSSRSDGVGRDRPLGLAQLARLAREAGPLARGEARLALLARASAARGGAGRSGARGRRSGRAPARRAARPGRGPPAPRPRRSCGTPRGALMRPARAAPRPRRSGAACRASTSTRSAGSLLREAAQRAPQADAAVPGALGDGAAVPAGRADAQAVARLALDRVAADHDVAQHEGAVPGQGIGRSLRSDRRGGSRARRPGRRRRAHRSGRRPRRPRAGASARW